MKYFNFKFLMVLLALAVAIPPAWAEETLTVANGTATNGVAPIYGSNYGTKGRVQMIYPSSMLESMTGKNITSITFYHNGYPYFSGGVVELYLGESEMSSFQYTTSYGMFDQASLTKVVTVNGITTAMNSSDYSFTFTFDTPYTYNGGNLVIETNIATKGASDKSKFYGLSSGGVNVIATTYTVSGSGNVTTMYPKATFTYEGGSTTPSVAIAPETLTTNDAAAGTFTVTGTNVDGSINASLASNTDWYMTPETLSNTGGDLSVSYTGRALSASNTITVDAASDNTISAQATVNYVADLYIVTDNGVTNNWDFNNGTQMTNNNGIYTASFTANADNTYILFARKLGDGVYWETRYVFGPDSNGDWVWGTNTGGNIDLNDDDPIKLPEAGIYTVTIDANAGTFTITKTLQQVATPTFSPAEGSFTEAQTVTILCATDGATISYSTDGGTTWTVGNSLTVSETTTVMAKATKDGMTDSEIATATYTINIVPVGQDQTITIGDESDYDEHLPVYGNWYDSNQRNQMIYTAEQLGWTTGTVVKAITFYPRSNLGFSEGKVKISLATTTETSVPTSGSYYVSSDGPIEADNLIQVAEIVPAASTTGEWTITFTTPFTYNGDNLLVEVNTEHGNYKSSYFYAQEQDNYVGYYSYTSSSGSLTQNATKYLPKATFTFTAGAAQEAVATPMFSPAAGTYTSAQSVAIACATDGATIYYTTDGSEPSATNGTVYSEAIAVNESMTIKAIAVKDGMANSAVAEAEYVINIVADYAVTVTPDGGKLNFGTVDYENNGTATRTITVTNNGLQPVTPTLSALDAPFTTDYTATALQPGESVTITITFTPTEEAEYNGTATLSFGNGIADRTFTLTGKGGKYDENDHSAIYDMTYDWTDDNGTPHTSSLLETATDPNQIIAMLRKIYMTPEIPGNKVRGYTEAGDAESLNVNGNDAYKVNYSAVGQLNSNLQYTDTYGWNIPTEKPILSRTKGSYTYNYMDPTEYEPNEEGLTLIMVEIKDGANYSGSSYYSFTNSNLKEKVANTFKSARIITTYKKSGSGEEAGTLFKIDADKLNRFFFLAKGQLRVIDHSQAYESSWTENNVHPYPSYRTGSYSSTFTDNTFNTSSGSAVLAPFEHMFEQFSPNQASTSTSAMTDVYQELVNMASYDVVHDCVSIPYVEGNHEFNMYGIDSNSDDCQDVRDMMFFVPDYRMKFWKESQYATGDKARDPNSVEKFVNYNKDHRPTLGLYVIRQNEITGEKQASADVYDLNLSWESNLLDFLPGDEAEYQLFRVETDENGTKTYTLVATIEAGQTTYVDHVPMDATGKVVTYVVQGQDTDHFLSLQMSNEESYIIPGTDPDELMSLDVRATHYSRFDPQSEKNYYANTLKVKNNVGTNVTADMLTVGSQFTFNRMYTDAENVAHTDVVAVAEVTRNTGSIIDLTITMGNDQRQLAEYPYGYLPNKGAHSFNVTDGVVDFGNFTVYDNFAVSVEGNQHPSMYKYKVLFGEKHSNEIGVMVHKTGMEMIAHDQATVDADLLHSEEILKRAFNIDVKYSSKTEILRYDAYRWRNDEEISETRKIIESGNTDGTEEEDVSPNGIAGNQATYYSIAMNSDYTGSVAVSQTAAAKAKFEDNIATQNWGAYVLAPVVETFTGRTDYNTYGGPLQGTATSSMLITVKDTREMSEYNWTDETTNNVYCYYTIPLDIVDMKVPDGYNVYKLRAWRKVDTNLLQEQLDERQYRLGVNGDYLFDEVTYPGYDKNANYEIGSPVVEEYETTTTPTETGYELKATFGAQKLSDGSEAGTITELPMEFIVRAYYTKESNLAQPNGRRAPRRIDGANADGKYYIMEQIIPFTLVKDDNLITSVQGVFADKQVMDEIYYNMMGQSSTKPFSGVNVKVTRYTDGTTSTTKVLK